MCNFERGKSMLRGYVLIIILCLSVAACATFAPQQGMSFADFAHMTAKSFNGAPNMVQMTGEITAYNLPTSSDPNVFYWFERGRLTRVTQGQLPQIRYQIEQINR